jgi:phosphatidylserine/phosphatidylglycerophosphate/cardiolipin synthase-like enzyme
MAEKNENDIDRSIKFRFEKFLKEYKDYFYLKATNNMHSKVLICDEVFAVTTSFNWLSFKGDKNRPVRDETGTYSEDIDYIKELTSDRLKFFKS